MWRFFNFFEENLRKDLSWPFQPLDTVSNHYFVDIAHSVEQAESTEDARFRCGSLKQDDIETWLDEDDLPGPNACENDDRGPRAASRLRVLLSTQTSDIGAMIPFTEQICSKIAISFDIPTELISRRFWQEHTIEFEAFSKGFGILICQLCLGYLIVTHDPSTMTTYAIGFQMRQTYIQYFVKCLYRLHSTSPLHFTVFAVWLSMACRDMHDQDQENMKKLTSIRKEAEVWDRHSQRRYKALEEVRFDWLIDSLTQLNGDLARTGRDLEICHQFVKRFLTPEDQLRELSSQKVLQMTTPRLCAAFCQLRNLFVRRERLHVDIENDMQMQWQKNVTMRIYNLLSQRDNEISLELAEASKKIAEASLRDAAAMRQLTKNSQEIAVRTYQDSVNMKIVALINLLTLPGTFTATFFSTSFFNFEPTHPNRVASAWLWIYFIVTTGLAAALAMCWYFWSAHAERKGALFQKALANPDDEENGNHEKCAARIRTESHDESLQERPSDVSHQDAMTGADADDEEYSMSD